MSEDSKPTSSQSRQGSPSASQSPDALDSLDDRSVRALTKAIIAWTTELGQFREAINTNTGAVMQLGSRLGKTDEYIAGFGSKADSLIIAGKLNVDAAATQVAALDRTRRKLEETGEHLLPRVEVTIAPRWTHRALDTLWPYAETSAQRAVKLMAASLFAGGGLVAAAHQIIAWFF